MDGMKTHIRDTYLMCLMAEQTQAFVLQTSKAVLLESWASWTEINQIKKHETTVHIFLHVCKLIKDQEYE